MTSFPLSLRTAAGVTFTPGPGLPVITDAGASIPDQATLDAVRLAAVKARVRLWAGGSSSGSAAPAFTPAQLAALDSSYAPISGSSNYAALGGPYKKWTDLPEPWVIPHRGAGQYLAPQNTMAAYKQGVAYGLGVIDGGDYRVLTDGAIGSMHDRTLSSLTTISSGNVDDLPGTAWQGVVLDTARWFGPGYGNQNPPLIDDVLALGKHVLLTPESKEDTPGHSNYQPVVAKILQHGLKDRVLFNSASIDACTYAVAQGISNVCWLPAGNVTPSSVLSSLSGTGVKYVALDYSQNSDANFTALISGGVKVVAYTLFTQYDWAHYISLGCVGCWSDDPVRLAFKDSPSKYVTTKASWPMTGMFSHGMRPYNGFDPAHRGSMVGAPGSYRWRFDMAADDFTRLGPLCPIANAAGTYTLTVPITFDAIGTDTNKHADITIGLADDRTFHNVGESWANGYNVLMRPNGSLQIYKITAGAATQIGSSGTSTIQLVTLSADLTSGVAVTALPVTALGSAVQAGHQFVLPTGQLATASAAATAGATSVSINSLTPSATVTSGTALPQQVTVKIAVTPTGVTISRTDGTTVNVPTSDTSYRGGYVYLGIAGRSTGLIVSYGQITVT